MNKKSILLVALLMMSSLVTIAVAQTAKESETGEEYPDGKGGKVYFPLGDVSFADEVVLFNEGDPTAKKEKDRKPETALGIPDYKDDENYVSLGCGGELTLRFTDNALTDIDGPDLYVFEIGPAVEPQFLAISADGRNWTEVGKISGGRAEVDIAEYVKPGEVFHYVKLRDLKSDCSGDWPGADIDAVGAIGAALQISLDSSVLFDTAKWDLSDRAEEELSRAADVIRKNKAGKVVIEGHTDSVGTDEYNQELSERRASSVRDYFVKQEGLEKVVFIVNGYGETRPVADNSTDEGKQKNRRVEVILIP